MNGFLYKLSQFMQGRYGMDKLNNAIFAVWLILAVVNIFLRKWYISLIMLLLIALYAFRFLSKNITMRSYENRKFMPIYDAVTGFFKLEYKKIKDIKTHRYIKCTHCKAQLRVPKRKGKHTVRCPKCGKTFEANIRY